MGTRSRIGIQLKDESIVSVYCHWDGYPEFNGRVLRDNYDSVEKIRDLIDGGNISALHTNAGWNNETLTEVGPLYYTMRGEKIENNEPKYHTNLNEFLIYADNECCAEYTYHFVNGEWVCHNLNAGPDRHMVKQVEIPEGPVA
jgi:hypothetical protein